MNFLTVTKSLARPAALIVMALLLAAGLLSVTGSTMPSSASAMSVQPTQRGPGFDGIGPRRGFFYRRSFVVYRRGFYRYPRYGFFGYRRGFFYRYPRYGYFAYRRGFYRYPRYGFFGYRRGFYRRGFVVYRRGFFGYRRGFLGARRGFVSIRSSFVGSFHR